MILICYDASADAQSAIEHAGALLAGQPVTVVTVWERFVDLMFRSGAGLGFGASILDGGEIDAAAEQEARKRAEEGAERAGRVGLDAVPRVAVRSGSIAGTILSIADEVGADAIVMGSRGLTGVRSLLLGSVSHGVLQHADRAVLVVPSPNVAAERAAQRR